MQLESDETKMYVDRSGRSKATDQLAPIPLIISREHERRRMIFNIEGKEVLEISAVEVYITPCCRKLNRDYLIAWIKPYCESHAGSTVDALFMISIKALEAVEKRGDLASEAMRETMRVMDTKARMMRWLAVGSLNLDLLLNICNSVSPVSIFLIKNFYVLSYR